MSYWFVVIWHHTLHCKTQDRKLPEDILNSPITSTAWKGLPWSLLCGEGLCTSGSGRWATAGHRGCGHCPQRAATSGHHSAAPVVPSLGTGSCRALAGWEWENFNGETKRKSLFFVKYQGGGKKKEWYQYQDS